MKLDYDEVKSLNVYLKKLVRGYKTMLGNQELSSEAKIELADELKKNETYLKTIDTWVTATDALIDSGYPKRKLGEASQAVLKEINDLMEVVSLVKSDFKETELSADSGSIGEK